MLLNKLITLFRNSRLYINATSILRNTLQHILPAVNICPTMYSSNILRGRYVIVPQLVCIRPVHVVFLRQYTRDTVVTFLRRPHERTTTWHYSDVIMSAMASQITGVWTVSPAVCSGADQRKHQSSTSLAFARGVHRWPVDSPHKGSATRKMFLFDDVIMSLPRGWYTGVLLEFKIWPKF